MSGEKRFVVDLVEVHFKTRTEYDDKRDSFREIKRDPLVLTENLIAADVFPGGNTAILRVIKEDGHLTFHWDDVDYYEVIGHEEYPDSEDDTIVSIVKPEGHLDG